MKKQIHIKTKDKNYKIIIENGSLKKYLKSELTSSSKKFIVVDDKISKKIKRLIKNNKKVVLIKIKGSETIKSIEIYWKIISKLLQKKINRSSTLIAIGGGTIGDLCGFIASTIHRGIRFVLIPTTLLSQVDSSIGGKNGINSKYGKNLVGTFYQPDFVVIDPSILKSLTLKQIRSGYAEILKHAIINDDKFYQWLKNNFNKIFKLDKKIVSYAIEKSIKIKANFIMEDEKESLKNSSSRAILNFGHTFGHALESINEYKSTLTHGEAISIGMVIAVKISHQIGRLSKYQLDDIIEHFNKCGLPTSNNLIKKDRYYKFLINDKKNQNKKINLILLNKIGEAFYAKNFELNKIKNLVLHTL